MSGYRVIKTNRFGKDQERILSLDFSTGSIVNKNKKGKTMKVHHGSSVLFCEPCGLLDLIVHLPKQKEYRLSFESAEERTVFQEKLVDLCKTTTKMNMPQEEEVFNHKQQSTDNAVLSYTMPMKVTEGNDIKLKDIVCHIDLRGVAICDPNPGKGGGRDEVALTVLLHYPFTKIQSWTNEGMYVVLETLSQDMTDEKYKFKSPDGAEGAAAFVEAIQVCLAAVMKEMERKKAEKKAKAAAKKAAAAGVPAPAKKTPAKARREDRLRRASLVVDMAAMAEGIGGGGQQSGGASKSGGGDANMIDDMMAGPDTMQSQRAMMAAAAAAVSEEGDGFMEDDVEDSIQLDIVQAMAEAQDAPPPPTAGRQSILDTRRRSVMMDVTGAGGEMNEERAKRAGLLKDLAQFVDDASRPQTIAEGDEEEEDEDDGEVI